MSIRAFLSLLALLLLMPFGCGGGDDGGRGTIRGVVVDGNPYTSNFELGGSCPEATGCTYKSPLPPTVAGVEVIVSQRGEGETPQSREVARVRTDAQGRFAVSLPPGRIYGVAADISQEKRDAGYCVSGGGAALTEGDDVYVVIGNDLCRNFLTMN